MTALPHLAPPRSFTADAGLPGLHDSLHQRLADPTTMLWAAQFTAEAFRFGPPAAAPDAPPADPAPQAATGPQHDPAAPVPAASPQASGADAGAAAAPAAATSPPGPAPGPIAAAPPPEAAPEAPPAAPEPLLVPAELLAMLEGINASLAALQAAIDTLSPPPPGIELPTLPSMADFWPLG